MDIVKINFTMTYLTRVAQNRFEVGLNQEDQDILQDWLSDWNLFVDELHRHFGLSDPVGEVVKIADDGLYFIFSFHFYFILFYFILFYSFLLIFYF